MPSGRLSRARACRPAPRKVASDGASMIGERNLRLRSSLAVTRAVGLTCETVCEVVRCLSKMGSLSLMDSLQAMLLVVMGTTAVLSFASMPWRLRREG